MSIYDRETKIYLDLNPSAPIEPQTYRLQKLTEIEAYLLNEIEDQGREVKKMKQFKTNIGMVHTGLITSTVIAGGDSIATSAGGVGPLNPRWIKCIFFFPFNGDHTEIFKNSRRKARKIQYH